MTVAEMSELRRLLREGKFEYRIIKNTLAKIASANTKVSVAQDSFTGPVGIAISYDDPVVALKRVLEYSSKNDKLTVNCSVIEGRFCSSDELKAISEIPPRDVLLSMLAGGLQSPLSKLAGALHATLCKFVFAIEALKIKKSQD